MNSLLNIENHAIMFITGILLGLVLSYKNVTDKRDDRDE
jgi:uncharacterized membrane protein